MGSHRLVGVQIAAFVQSSTSKEISITTRKISGTLQGGGYDCRNGELLQDKEGIWNKVGEPPSHPLKSV